VKCFGFWGGSNLFGGDCANGIPKNLLTEAVAVGRVVVVPITTPASMVAVGAAAYAAPTHREHTMLATVKRILADLVRVGSFVLDLIQRRGIQDKSYTGLPAGILAAIET